MRKKKRTYDVPPKKVSELLQDPDIKRVPDLEATGRGLYKVYELADGKILLVIAAGEQPPGVLYESREHLEEVDREAEAAYQQGPVHILEGRLPQGKDFVSHIPELIDQLAIKLRLPRQELDKSIESLPKFERAISRRGYARCLKADIFAPLVAYIGEVMKQAVHGEWQMVLDKENNIWEPWIVDAQGHRYNPFIPLWDALEEERRLGSLEGMILGSIDHVKLKIRGTYEGFKNEDMESGEKEFD